MVWESGQLNVRATIVAGCKHNAKHIGNGDRIFTKSFVEISHPVQQNCIRILGLEFKILGHQWRHLAILFRFLHTLRLLVINCKRVKVIQFYILLNRLFQECK